jgi:hypothetical protein
LPLFKGKQTLARLLFKKAIANKKNFWVRGKQDCEYLLPNLIENIGFEIFINGIYEEETSDFFADKIPLNGVFLDLGANIGAVSIPKHSINKKEKRYYSNLCRSCAVYIHLFTKKSGS